MFINSRIVNYMVIYCVYKIESYTKMKKKSGTNLLLLEVRMVVILVTVIRVGASGGF